MKSTDALASTSDGRLLLPAWLALGFLVSQFAWIWRHRPEYHFGWIVLLLSLFLFYEAWPARPERVRGQHWLAGLLFGLGFAIAGCVRLYASALGMGPTALFALGMGVLAMVGGNVVYLMGVKGLTHFAFPLGFLILAFPPPGFLGEWIVGNLKEWIAVATVDVLKLGGIPAQRTGNLIHVVSGTVGVEDACSGVRSLQSALMATLFVSHLAFRGWCSRLLLVGAGCGLALATNLGRSVWLSVVAHRRGPEAVDRLHDPAGWLILICTLSGVLLVVWACRRMESYLPHGTRPVGSLPHAP